jgi:hypothetical protein
VDEIHDRMPVTTSRYDYSRWLGEEPDPRDLMRPFPLGVMWMWPISTGVNKPENDNVQSSLRSKFGHALLKIWMRGHPTIPTDLLPSVPAPPS